MLKKMCLIVFLIQLILGLPPAIAAETKNTKSKEDPAPEELLTRIDFGNSYVTGQALKSGAIYLLQRKKNQVKSMLTYRENYRKEILESHDIRKTEDSKDEAVKTVK